MTSYEGTEKQKRTYYLCDMCLTPHVYDENFTNIFLLCTPV